MRRPGLGRASRTGFVFAVAGALTLSLPPRARGQEWGAPAWSDEFDGRAGSAPDPARWTYDVGDLNVNHELEIYCAPGSASPPCDPRTPNAYLDGRGRLVIQAVRTASGQWTSARLKTQGLEEVQYGRIEARMRLPVGAGMWPAFWMLGGNISSAGWPACGEMDLMENVPLAAGLGPTTIRSTLHGPGYSGSAGLGQSYTLPDGGRVDTADHSYGLIWSPYMVQFYVDDPRNVFFVRTARDVPAGTTWVYDHPFFAIVNLAVGGDWPGPPDASTPDPATMLVDYVRVYQASPVRGPAFQAQPLSVRSGGTATGTVDLQSTPGTGRVYLACAGAPPGATCSVDPYVVDFSDSAHATTALAVATGVSAAGGGSLAGLGAALLSLVALLLPRRARLALGGATAVLLLTLGGLSCGGGGGSASSPGSRTPAGSYTLTLTAYTVSGDTSTVEIPLTVQP